MKLDDFEMAVIDLAHEGVRLTVPNVVARLKVSPTKTEAWLDELAKKGRLDVEVDEREGVVFYRVRGLTAAPRRDPGRALARYGERGLAGRPGSALGRTSLPKKRKSLIAAFLLGLILPGLGLFYAAPWVAAIAATLGAMVLLWLAKLPLIGGIIGAGTAIASGVAGILYASEFNKTGQRSAILTKEPKQLPSRR